MRTRKLPAIKPNTTDNRRAVITGISGQDGSYLAELLLEKGYELFGVVKDDPTDSHENLEAVRDRVSLVSTDLCDASAVRALFADVSPTEVYNLAAPSVVGASWDDPPRTLSFMTESAVNLLEAILREAPGARFFHAASSEIFRGTDTSPQNELTTPRPTSPYGVGKLAGHALVDAYRRRHGVHASSGILYNHESPRRPRDFVPSKIVNAAAEIKLGLRDELALGDLSAKRDWGYAVDYTHAMWQMLQADEPDDYVIATGVTHTVGDIVETAFGLLGLEPERYVTVDPRFLRAGDETILVGDPSRIERALGWKATTGFAELIEIMVTASLAAHDAAPVALDAQSDG